MKQKTILTIGILSLLSLAVFVSANMTPYSSDGYNHNVKVYLYKGWNLVLSTDLDRISDTSQIKQSDILATYIYAPEEAKYLQLYPDKSEFNSYVSGLSEFSEDAGRIMISPMWIYSNKEGYFEYSRVDVPKIYDVTLISGWNFVTVTPEMKGNSLSQIEGSCNIEKAYWWNSESDETEQGTNWKDFPLTGFEFGEETGDSIFGTGIIIKVTNNCKLATGGSVTPPTIPN